MKANALGALNKIYNKYEHFKVTYFMVQSKKNTQRLQAFYNAHTSI